MPVAFTEDGMCQYQAVSYALFNSMEHASKLRDLVVDYMSLHREHYEVFLASEFENERKEVMQALYKSGKVTDTGFVGFLQALRSGAEWGNEHTLTALGDLLALAAIELRVVANLPCPSTRGSGMRGGPRLQLHTYKGGGGCSLPLAASSLAASAGPSTSTTVPCTMKPWWT